MMQGAGGGIALYDNYVDIRIDRSTIAGNTSTRTPVFLSSGVWFGHTLTAARPRSATRP